MDGIGERIRHRESLDKVMTAAQAAELIEDGMIWWRPRGIP